jgi:hypothetical protein
MTPTRAAVRDEAEKKAARLKAERAVDDTTQRISQLSHSATDLNATIAQQEADSAGAAAKLEELESQLEAWRGILVRARMTPRGYPSVARRSASWRASCESSKPSRLPQTLSPPQRKGR